MNLIFLMRNKMEEGRVKRVKHDNRGKSVKCKYCKMGFENKERLKVHSRIAHSGRGERKKE